MVVMLTFLNNLAHVLGIITMLTVQPTCIQIVILQSGPQENFSNRFVQMHVHPNFKFVPCSWPKSCHASPNHHRPNTMLHCLILLQIKCKISLVLGH